MAPRARPPTLAASAPARTGGLSVRPELTVDYAAGGMVESYLTGAGAPGGPDEAVRAGAVLPAYTAVLDVLDRLGTQELRARAASRDDLARRRGMTFPLPGSGQQQRLLPLDLVPRVVDPAEWALVARGLEQRARALGALLTDLAGPRECVAAGVVPAAQVPTAPQLAPHLPAGWAAAATVAGMDLLRDGSGRWRVLEDNLRVPSGLGYAVLVREVAAAALPELKPGPRVADPAAAVPLLLAALLAAAPARATANSALAVLSAGPGDSAYAEHRLLADRLDVPLVTPGSLRREGAGLAGPDGRVDVLYRRLDEEELAGARLGDGAPALATLTAAVRSGTLGLANALGTAVADDKAVYACVPALVHFFLGEQPLLDDVRTFVLADPVAREEALDRLDELVVKPVDGYGGRDVVFGAALGRCELVALGDRLQREPERWVAQEPVLATTHPTLAPDGASLQACSVDLRAFVVAGIDASGRPDPGGAVTLPAALTRVAPPGSRVVNSSRGGGAKDTWLPA